MDTTDYQSSLSTQHSALSTYDRPSTTGIVLAGGLSRRMGQDKRRLQLWGDNGPTLLGHTSALLAGLCDEVIVVLNDPELWPALPAQLVTDQDADGGSLGGIYSGLVAATHEYALVVACDMPFLNTALLNAMLKRSRDYDALVPRSPERGASHNAFDVEPLHAIYSKACLPHIRVLLDTGRRQIAQVFAHVRVTYVERDEIRTYDPDGRSFLNLNTPEQAMASRQSAVGSRWEKADRRK